MQVVFVLSIRLRSSLVSTRSNFYRLTANLKFANIPNWIRSQSSEKCWVKNQSKLFHVKLERADDAKRCKICVRKSKYLDFIWWRTAISWMATTQSTAFCIIIYGHEFLNKNPKNYRNEVSTERNRFDEMKWSRWWRQTVVKRDRFTFE